MKYKWKTTNKKLFYFDQSILQIKSSKVFQGLESSVFSFLYEEAKKLSVGLFVK